MRRIASLVAAVLLVPCVALAEDRPLVPEKDGYMCPAGDEYRSPEQVIADRLAAISVGNLDLFMCSYSADAVVVMPGSVARGRDQIKQGFIGLFSLLGNTMPTVTSITYADEAVLMTFHVATAFFSIPDGADTFIVRHGKIQYQTAHATLHFGP